MLPDIPKKTSMSKQCRPRSDTVYRLSSRPYFSLLFFLPYFSLLFSENTQLSLLFSPKMFEVTKIVIFFLARSEFGKIRSTLSEQARCKQFKKNIFTSVVTPFLEHLFWYFLSMVMLCYCSGKFLFAYCIFF